MKTTKEVAELYRITPRRVLAIAHNRGVRGRRVGQAWLWGEAEVKRLEPGEVGKPRKRSQNP